MTYPIYPKYKKTNTPWIGGIPAHWELLPGLAVIQENKTKNSGLIETQVLSLSYGRIVIKPLDKLHGLVPESFETYQIVAPGDIIIRPTDLQNDKKSLRVGQVKNRGIITSAYISLKPKYPGTEDFLFRLFQAYDFMKVFYGLGSGLRQNMGFNDLRRLPILLPPLNEQILITKYLTQIEIKIAHLMQKKKRLISLLKEQKQAIINQAVTRGLDANAPMKASGVECLGDIPKHWNVRRLRTIVDVRTSGVDKNSVEEEISVNLCNYVDVYKNNEITSKIEFMKATATSAEIQRFKLEIGDVIITKDSETWQDIAVPAFVSESLNNVICGYHLSILRPHSNQIYGEYLFRAIESDPIADQFRTSANGVTRFGLSQGVIKDAFIPIPPLNDQFQIIAYIKEKCAQIDLTITNAESEIKLIQEYRPRLISDVVTGKIDVRDVKIEEISFAEITDSIIDTEGDEESLELTRIGNEVD